MIGYAGLSADPLRQARFERLAARSGSRTHREAGFAIGVTTAASPVAATPATTPAMAPDMALPAVASSRRAGLLPRADLLITGRYVLAFEGYLADLPAAWSQRPAAWLLDAHARQGLTAFDSLNGAHTLCLYDRVARRAWISGCAFGRRDLYYLREDDAVLFASDLAALLRLAAQRPALAMDATRASLLCGATYGGDTLLTGVRRTLPGARVDCAAGIPIESAPARLPGAAGDAGDADADAEPISDAEALEELDRRLRVAVDRLQPVTQRRAVLMSAGIDSPLVAAYVKAVTGDLEAITLTMPWPPDETADATAIARALGARHHVWRFDMQTADLLGDIDAFVRVMEEPTAVGLGLLTMGLARQARTLADGFVFGVSADALFGDPLASPDDPDSGSIFHYMFREVQADRLGQVIALDGPHPDGIVAALRARLAGDAARERRRLPLLLQSGLMIRSAARMARFHGAEALFPYLDAGVVQLALRLPAALRTRDKPLLRQLAARHYGADLQRARKIPFAAYPIKWLQLAGRLTPLLDLLDERRTRERGLYHADGLRRLVTTYREGRGEPPEHLVLWQVIVFELFCRRFVDAPADEPGDPARSQPQPAIAAPAS